VPGSTRTAKRGRRSRRAKEAASTRGRRVAARKARETREAPEFFKGLLDGVMKGWMSQDPAKAAPFYSKKPGLVFYDFAPLKYKGWNDYAEGVRKAFFDKMPPNSSRLKTFDDFQVMNYGNVAVTAVTFHFWAQMNDQTKVESDGRHTAVWEKTGKKWLIVHDHWSFPFSPRPPAMEETEEQAQQQ
jgi:ketosteroid isomerase-like protein